MLLRTDSYGISPTRRSNSWWESCAHHSCNGTEDEIESPNILVVSREEPSNHICHFLFEKCKLSLSKRGRGAGREELEY